jgi:hypothetical protein
LKKRSQLRLKTVLEIKQEIYENPLTSNPRIPEYQDFEFCLRIPTLENRTQVPQSRRFYRATSSPNFRLNVQFFQKTTDIFKSSSLEQILFLFFKKKFLPPTPPPRYPTPVTQIGEKTRKSAPPDTPKDS